MLSCTLSVSYLRSTFISFTALCLALLALQSLRAHAQTPPPAEPEPAAAPPPAPYSLPWQLRPAAVATVLRSDTAFAFYEHPVSEDGGTTIASMLLGSYKLTDAFAPLVRLGVVSNSPPAPPSVAGMPAPGGGFSFINPVVGGTYLIKFSPELKLALFLGLAIPVGSGGGDSPDADTALATRSGILARSAMDNAMFAVNDFTIFPGVDLAYVAHGFTFQIEATLLQLLRVRGSKVQKDSSKTNTTFGVHAGYFFIPELSAGVELRHQRWISTPAAVKSDTTDSLRDTTTVALGIRTHFKLSDTLWLRPGLAYARGLDDPMDVQGYNIVQLDVPVIF